MASSLLLPYYYSLLLLLRSSDYVLLCIIIIISRLLLLLSDSIIYTFYWIIMNFEMSLILWELRAAACAPNCHNHPPAGSRALPSIRASPSTTAGVAIETQLDIGLMTSIWAPKNWTVGGGGVRHPGASGRPLGTPSVKMEAGGPRVLDNLRDYHISTV